MDWKTHEHRHSCTDKQPLLHTVTHIFAQMQSYTNTYEIKASVGQFHNSQEGIENTVQDLLSQANQHYLYDQRDIHKQNHRVEFLRQQTNGSAFYFSFYSSGRK